GWQAGHPKVTQAQAKAMAEGKKKGQPVPPVSPPGTVARGTPFVSGQDAAPGPAYTPPRPWRVWLAPYSRNDGTLASGSYLWFTTPGHWNYLGRQWQAPPFASIPKQTQTFGSADTGANGPVPPSELGFTPGQARAPKGVLDNITQPGMAKSQ
ncbi:MAG: hypothetical protein L0H29_06965, partial [Sinobacteraceae bacterium]|nr:hypothetical protein [Nevskiaceae bacterium]